MKTKSMNPTPEMLAFREDMLAVLRKHQHLTPDAMLAVSAYFVGQLLAMQDQRKMTPAMGLKLISDNIEAGNSQAIEKWLGTPAGGDSRDIMDGRGRRDVTRKPRS